MFQPGNQEWRKRQVMTDALRKELIQFEDKVRGIESGKAAHKIAKNVIEAAVNGEQWAMVFLFERMDGKAIQRTEQKHEHSFAESISEEHARIVAEGFIESLRSPEGGVSSQSGGVHDGVPAGLPSGTATP